MISWTLMEQRMVHQYLWPSCILPKMTEWAQEEAFSKTLEVWMSHASFKTLLNNFTKGQCGKIIRGIGTSLYYWEWKKKLVHEKNANVWLKNSELLLLAKRHLEGFWKYKWSVPLCLKWIREEEMDKMACLYASKSLHHPSPHHRISCLLHNSILTGLYFHSYPAIIYSPCST